MASTIEYWNAELPGMTTSRDAYEELRQSLEYDEEVGDYYRHREVRAVTGYIHEPTGLVTTDIAKFEAWLIKIGGM